MSCWAAFHEGSANEQKLKDGRTVSKTHNAMWPKSITIAKMIMKYQCQGDDLGEYLQEQQYDFCKAVTFSNGNKDGTKTGLGFADAVDMHDNGFCDTLAKVDIKLAEVVTSVRPGQKVFILLDSCAAICASDVTPYFHGGKQACNFGVKGVDALCTLTCHVRGGQPARGSGTYRRSRPTVYWTCWRGIESKRRPTQ
jgi:hypothetical protein